MLRVLLLFVVMFIIYIILFSKHINVELLVGRVQYSTSILYIIHFHTHVFTDWFSYICDTEFHYYT